MAAKRFQTRTEEEIEQLHNKSFKYTNDVFIKALTFAIWINIYDLRLI